MNQFIIEVISSKVIRTWSADKYNFIHTVCTHLKPLIMRVLIKMSFLFYHNHPTKENGLKGGKKDGNGATVGCMGS